MLLIMLRKASCSICRSTDPPLKVPEKEFAKLHELIKKLDRENRNLRTENIMLMMRVERLERLAFPEDY